MEFWGVEVKSGESLEVEPGDDMMLHLSQASLGDVKKDKGSESVYLYLKFGDKKLVLGTLSSEKFPQIFFDLVFEKKFELSHNWKNGSVYFTGYKVVSPTDDNSSDDYEIEEQLPLMTDNGRNKAVAEKVNATKPESTAAKQKVKIVEPNKDVKPNQKDGDSDDDEDDSSDDDSSDESGDDQGLIANGDNESNEGSSGDEDDDDDDEDDDDVDDDESSDDDEGTPKKKAEPSKKRSAESAVKTPVPEKKAKFVTPQKNDGKKGGHSHTATPHPAKQAGKKPASSDQTKPQTQKFPCKSCSRSFSSDTGLQAHTKAKHSATA